MVTGGKQCVKIMKIHIYTACCIISCDCDQHMCIRRDDKFKNKNKGKT